VIKELEKSEGSILAFKISAKVTLEEERQWIQKFDNALKKHDKISALIILGEEASWGLKAGVEDIKWIMTHLDKLHRLALVTDSTVWKWLIKIDSPFAKMAGIGEKYFPLSELDDAWDWVKNKD